MRVILKQLLQEHLECQPQSLQKYELHQLHQCQSRLQFVQIPYLDQPQEDQLYLELELSHDQPQVHDKHLLKFELLHLEMHLQQVMIPQQLSLSEILHKQNPHAQEYQ